MLTLIPDDDPVLHTACPIVNPSVDHPELGPWDEIIKEMFSVMKNNNGCGLAAPQVGIQARLFLLDIDNIKYVCFNPKVTKASKDQITLVEGCLSYPGKKIAVPRPAKVATEYSTPSGIKRTKKMTGWQARAFQHELDHLNGIVFTEYEDGDS